MSTKRNIRKLKIAALAVMTVSLTIAITTTFDHSAVPVSAYGAWDRGPGEFDPNDPDYDYLLGLTSSNHWADIQPVGSSQFSWGEVQSALQLAYDRGQWFYAKINVGPDSPEWIYNNGVPKVTATGHKYTEFPYYLDPNYITFYHDLIREFGSFLRSQPQHLQDRIAFVPVQTGSTGDEAPYKGTIDDPQYAISDAEWLDFRLVAFEEFRVAFQEGPGKVIPLMFNNISSINNPDEWNWVNTNVTGGWGFKGSAYVRGHHLTGARTFTEQWKPYTVNPQGPALFSRAEMDQTWKKPYYQLNLNLGFYWGAISGLNSGLTIWDITSSALDQAAINPSIQETFRFFNKYAGQIYPADSTNAFIALHEGLDSSDSVKFPEATYGNASKSNQARYEAICNDPVYAARGAQMEDLYAATRGQVYQRSNQTGYNDAGWEIWPGNYSRFITQIAPDNESIGLFRIGGNIDANSPIYSRFARAFENSSGKNAMYFKLEDGFFNWPAGVVTIKVIYYDDINGSTWDLKYDAGAGNFKTAYTVTCTGSDTWETKTVTVTDAVMLHNGPNGADFALVNSDGQDDIFHMIEIARNLGLSPDINGDGDINFEDFVYIARYWLLPCSSPGWCEGADLNASGLVDWQDVERLCQSWLKP